MTRWLEGLVVCVWCESRYPTRAARTDEQSLENYVTEEVVARRGYSSSQFIEGIAWILGQLLSVVKMKRTGVVLKWV